MRTKLAWSRMLEEARSSTRILAHAPRTKHVGLGCSQLRRPGPWHRAARDAVTSAERTSIRTCPKHACTRASACPVMAPRPPIYAARCPRSAPPAVRTTGCVLTSCTSYHMQPPQHHKRHTQCCGACSKAKPWSSSPSKPSKQQLMRAHRHYDGHHQSAQVQHQPSHLP